MLAPDGLTDWRDMFDKARRDSLATPKVGLMKLARIPGQYRYAVAVRDGSDLWLTLWVKRSKKGVLHRSGAPLATPPLCTT